MRMHSTAATAMQTQQAPSRMRRGTLWPRVVAQGAHFAEATPCLSMATAPRQQHILRATTAAPATARRGRAAAQATPAAAATSRKPTLRRPTATCRRCGSSRQSWRTRRSAVLGAPDQRSAHRRGRTARTSALASVAGACRTYVSRVQGSGHSGRGSAACVAIRGMTYAAARSAGRH